MVYLAVLWLPGCAIGYLLRARGWTLVASAPLITYGAAGVCGPLLSVAHIPWSATTFAVGTAAVTVPAVIIYVRQRRSRRAPVLWKAALPRWTGAAHLSVAATLVVAAAAGGAAIATAMHDISAIPQDWDAVFHAAGIRWIADTGDGGLYAMSQVNWFEPGTQLFYPNAYHLLGAVVYQVGGASVPAVLNAHTLLIPGITALSVVALVRRMGGRAVVAGASAVVVVSLSALYDMLWRGPLLPYATGVALTPLVVVLLLDVLDTDGTRALVRPGLLFAVGLAGLVCLQPASLLSAFIFAAPALAQRWWSRPRLAARDIPVVMVFGTVAAALASLELVAGLATAGGLDAQDWPADLSRNEALGELLTFSHAAAPQMWIIAACLAGALTYRRLGDLRWIGVVAAAFGFLFVVAASSDAAWANSITRFWWNDRWRLVAPAAIAAGIIAGHGLGETQRRIVQIAGRLRRTTSPLRPRIAARAAVAAAVLLLFAVASHGLYMARNAARMSASFTAGPAVTAAEITGLGVLAQLAGPGARVLNDRGDGSAWMYPLTGLHPVAGHYNGGSLGPEATLLAARFNTYPDDAAVRDVVDRLGIHYVVLSDTFLRPWATRQPGLTGLDSAPWLERVYQNSDVEIFRIKTEGTAPQAASR